MIDKRFPGVTFKIGKEHTYLGTTIKILLEGNVSIDMTNYVWETIVASTSNISKFANSPSKGQKFPNIGQKRKEIFHHCVTKPFYVAKRCRIDIQLAIRFLCSRVAKSMEQDWAKLKRVLQYLHGTLDQKIIIGTKDIRVMNLYVVASYALYVDIKSHTGGCIIFDRVAIMSKSIKPS